MDDYYFYMSFFFLFSRSQVGKVISLILLLCIFFVQKGYA